MPFLIDALTLLFAFGLFCLLLGAVTNLVEWLTRKPLSPEQAFERLGQLVDDDTRARLIEQMRRAR